MNPVPSPPGCIRRRRWARPAGANVDTLIAGPNGSSLVGIYTGPDGRQTMYQTFNENQYYLQSQLLRHGELDWLARNTFFGDQRNYFEMDIDDTFTPDDMWDTATHWIDYSDADAMRMSSSDVATAATWETNHNFRMDQLFNMGGSVVYQADNGGTIRCSLPSKTRAHQTVDRGTPRPASPTRTRSVGSAIPTTRLTWTWAARPRTTSRPN